MVSTTFCQRNNMIRNLQAFSFFSLEVKGLTVSQQTSSIFTSNNDDSVNVVKRTGVLGTLLLFVSTQSTAPNTSEDNGS